MIGSNEINKSLRKIFSPVLRKNGFSKVRTRNNWGYHGTDIWVLNIRAVGNYFSQVTGWPPMSLTVWLGIFDTNDIGWREKNLKIDKDGLLLPQEYLCHKRSHLEISYDQSLYQNRLSSDPEKNRSDIWWIEPDGSNIEIAIDNVKKSFLKQGIIWLKSQQR